MAEPRYKKLHKALIWAAKRHKKQDREGLDPLPYITHPVEVVSLLRHVGNIADEDMLCAAALHDTIEESGARASKIERRFGKRVRALVEELTRHEPSADQIDQLTEAEVAQLRSDILLHEIAGMSPQAQAIKLADRVANLSSAFVAKSGESLERYVKQSRKILEIIPKQVNPALWQELYSMLPGEQTSDAAV